MGKTRSIKTQQDIAPEQMIDIMEVDLRWGIPEEDSENSQISHRWL